MEESHILVGELAERCGLTTRTLRVYERRGLIAPVTRGNNNYRLFDPAVVPAILVFGAMLSLGLSLNEICEIFAGSSPIRHAPGAAETRDSMARAKDVYARHIAAVDAERERLAGVRAGLEERLNNCVRELAHSGPVQPPRVRKPQRRSRPGRVEYLRES